MPCRVLLSHKFGHLSRSCKLPKTFKRSSGGRASSVGLVPNSWMSVAEEAGEMEIFRKVDEALDASIGLFLVCLLVEGGNLKECVRAQVWRDRAWTLLGISILRCR